MSIYAGLSAALDPLYVSFFNLELKQNVFTNCAVDVAVDGGNAYGGGVSVYFGAFSSVFNRSGSAVAAAGDTNVHNAGITLDTATFTSCSALRRNWDDWADDIRGASVFGGSFSFYIGAFAWSQSTASNRNFISRSTCGVTNVSSVDVRIFGATIVGSLARSAIVQGFLSGANVYGGAMSVLHVGSFAFSYSEFERSSSSSTSGASITSGLSVQVRDFSCRDCTAVSVSTFGGNVFGGSLSALHIGAYAWSLALADTSTTTSKCGVTIANEVSVSISKSTCTLCSVLSTTFKSRSNGANSYGGCISALHVGAYAWSLGVSDSSQSRSECDATIARAMSVNIDTFSCSNCSAMSKTGGELASDTSNGANVYGGSVSAAYFGAYAYSFAKKDSSSIVKETLVSNLVVAISNSAFKQSIASSGECPFTVSCAVVALGG